MFRPTCRSSSPFSLTDLDMWDTRSRFAAQTSAWCGMAAVSGTGFLSKVNTSSCGSAGGLRQNDPGLRKWQSLSHLEPRAATCSFPPGAELRAARGERSFRQAEAGQWIQDAHERLDSQFNSLRTRNSPLSHSKTAAHLLDMKHQEKELAEFSQFETSRQRGELHEKVIQLEKELLQMRSSMGRGGSDQTVERTPASHENTYASSQEDLNRPESQKVDSELHKLREALREAETRAKTQEEERKRALQKLQTSIETQSTLLNQIEEMNQKLSNMKQNQCEVQEQLSEANNKISQACLEKATLMTQVMKLEDKIKVLMSKQAEDQSEKEKLIKEKADLHQRNQVLDLLLKRDQKGSEGSEGSESSTSKEDGEKVQMREESKALRKVNEKLTHELEMAKQKLTTSQSELQETMAERDVLSKQVTELKSESSQLVREKDKLLSLVSEGGHEKLTEMKEKCCQFRESVEALQSEKLKLQDQCLCLEAKVLEKEEKLQLQVEDFKRQEALRVQAFEEQKAVASHWTDKWQKVALKLQATQEELEELKKNTLTKRNESDSLLRVQLDACKEEPERSRNQVQPHGLKGSEALQTQDAAEAVTDLSESSLLLEEPSDSHTNQNKTPQVKDEKPSVESKKEKTVFQVNPEADQQRRLVTEQLKSLFKEREGKEEQAVDNSSAGAQTGAPPPQDRSQKAVRKAGDRRIWQHGSGLMPVFEEDEESRDCSGGEDGELIKLPTEMLGHTMGAGIINLNVEHENLLQALICKQQTADYLSDASFDVKVPNIPNYSDENSLQKMRPPPIYPDGIFLAERVDICSPDEEEEEGVD